MTHVKSPYSGTASIFHADDEADVEAGDTILSVEAMKLLYGIEAPVSGKVKFLIKLGSYVNEGQIVAAIL